MQAQEIMEGRPEAEPMTEDERMLVEAVSKLEGAEKVFLCEIMRALVNGDKLESVLIHQPHEYRAIMKNSCLFTDIMGPQPLMRYIWAKWGDMGDVTLTLAMAYHVGIADGKRLDRARRAAGRKVPA